MPALDLDENPTGIHHQGHGSSAEGYLHGVPSVPFDRSSEGGLSFQALKRVVVDLAFTNESNANGATLIPPTLWEFAKTFQADVGQALGVNLWLEVGEGPSSDAIFLTIGNSEPYKDAAGRDTAEGYSLTVGQNGIVISGASSLGTWWGTRSVLQIARLYDYRLPYGSGTDAPGWRTRGVMLDAGRHYYPPDFIVELCAYLSALKQNELHLHVSDNLFANSEAHTLSDVTSLYGAFRLLSDNPTLAGLAGQKNESYTHTQFEAIQQQCGQRGVTVIPEIEAPAHALAITRWKPEIALNGDPTMLNVSQPETMPTLEEIWTTFLPWFHSKEVHIGADEYSTHHITEYASYVNQLSAFIQATSSKRTRIWGTFTPAQGSNVSTEVTIQHWASYAGNAYTDFIANGYETINSDSMFYIVGKWSPYFGQRLNKSLIFNANPLGGAFAPHIFDASNATNNPPRDSPYVVGHITPFWSDWGPTATTHLEAYYAWRNELPALADKQWGGSLVESEYDAIIPRLQTIIPGQNLDRRIKSQSSLILQYSLSAPQKGKRISDTSGNDYHGSLHGDCQVGTNGLYFSGSCRLDTPLVSVGRNYTVHFEVKPTSSSPGTLFAGRDNTLRFTTDAIRMISGSHPYALNYTIPLNRWTVVELIGRGESTFLEVSSPGERTANRTFEFLTRIDTNGAAAGGEYNSMWRPMAFEAPLASIGAGFRGYMRHIEVRKDA
ncbi:glycoside hydrolase superfamily [Aspergillus recurvatus]